MEKKDLAEYEKNVNRNMHKYNVYRNAASTLAQHPTRIKNGDEAKKLKGIGLQISKKIDEYLLTGKLQKLEKIRKDDTSTAITELIRVTGIGPAKARELAEAGITGIKDLEKNKDKLNHHQLIGLKYVEEFELKIPRAEIEDLEKCLKKVLKGLDPLFKLTICGSYRRGAESSGDIDGLVTHQDFTSDSDSKKSTMLKDIVTALEKEGVVTDTLSLGVAKFMGICQLDSTHHFRRLDLRLIPIDQYHCGVLYFTGSDIFNKNMRAHALEIGFTLNEYCLKPMGSTGIPGEPLPIESERDIFDYLDMSYKEPKDRKS